MVKRSHDSMSASERRSSPEACNGAPESDEENNRIVKSVGIDNSHPSESTVMQCSLPPHATTLHFPSLETFEVHYAKEHTNRCASCGKNFPSAHFLALHHDELHNPVREVLAAKGEKTYSCFVEDCERKCSNATKRRMHLIDKHGFPKAYNFRVVQTGVDHSTSLLREGRRRRVSTTTDPASRHQRRTSQQERYSHDDHPDRVETSHVIQPRNHGEDTVRSKPLSSPVTGSQRDLGPDDHMAELETSLSALSFIPRSVLTRQTQK